MIAAMPEAPEGIVRTISEQAALREMKPGDLVLCRVNRHLIPAAYSLIRRGVKAIVRGRDIGLGLENLVKRLTKDNPQGSTVYLLEELREWEKKELARLRAMGDKAAGRIQSVEDSADTIAEICSGADTIPQVLERIGSLFKDFNDDGKPVEAAILGTMFRTKGLEANRVYVLKPELMPHPLAGPNFYKGELCCIYVTVTRAKWSNGLPGELIFCGPVPEPVRDAMPARPLPSITERHFDQEDEDEHADDDYAEMSE